ncbi:MAG: hypothetical protein ACYTG0_18435 [Planctomycetota bacterium]|jgi:hypothetical protein
MMRVWTGLALLAISWLLGLHCFQPARWMGFFLAIAAGTALLASRPIRLPIDSRRIAVAVVMLLPAGLFMPWPYRAAPLLIAAGLALPLLPVGRAWPRSLGSGGVVAGVVLLGQSLALWVYAGHTARCHDLPSSLTWLLGRLAWLLGIDAAVDGSTIVLHSTGRPHRLGATWELVLDPATWCFFFGGLVWLGVAVFARSAQGQRWSRWLRAARALTLVVVAWLPLRAGLLMTLYLHRAIGSDPGVRPTAMRQFLSPWVYLILLLGPALLAWRFVRLPAADPIDAEGTVDRESPGWRKCVLPPALVFAALAVAAFAIQWDPVGHRKDGRVTVVERHSTWEPTDRPYDTAHFGEAPSYSYTRLYDYCAQYFHMSRLVESDSIDREGLGECDVLVVKIPTARFSRRELEAVVEFVEEGGGLLLIGDHTNVFNSGTYLNDLARPFGFTFRHDLLFCVGSPYDQEVRPAVVPHPAVQHVPPMHYAVSCSIDPGASSGRAVVGNTGLWSLPADYHIENYHPHAEYRPEMRFGAFIQLWATRFGKGRVLAFTDSTIFSNFCVFQPGKAELMLGMVEWLNHTSVFDRAVPKLLLNVVVFLGALGLLVVGLLLAWARGVEWTFLLSSGMLGSVAGLAMAASVHRLSMPKPRLLDPNARMTHVVIDRTVSAVPLSLGAETQGDGRGYGLLEQWIWRLGYSSRRAGRLEGLGGDALVVICPTRSVPHAFREALVRYVASGGRLLVIDSPDSVGSTANSLLWPFGMAVVHATAKGGELALADGWPGVPVEASCEIQGGEPLMWVDGMPAAARVRYPEGGGSVMAIGFGSFFNDAAMGYHWMLTPDEEQLGRADLDRELLTRYDVLFALVRGLVEDVPVTAPPADAASPDPASEQRSG